MGKWQWDLIPDQNQSHFHLHIQEEMEGQQVQQTRLEIWGKESYEGSGRRLDSGLGLRRMSRETDDDWRHVVLTKTKNEALILYKDCNRIEESQDVHEDSRDDEDVRRNLRDWIESGKQFRREDDDTHNEGDEDEDVPGNCDDCGRKQPDDDDDWPSLVTHNSQECSCPESIPPMEETLGQQH